jgi:hypothetical protein
MHVLARLTRRRDVTPEPAPEARFRVTALGLEPLNDAAWAHLAARCDEVQS